MYARKYLRSRINPLAELFKKPEFRTVVNRVYLDWNATAPLRPEARAAMHAALELCGNPSSVHAEGRRARQIVEAARKAIGRATGADPANIVFTSGGTEANAMALQAATAAPRRGVLVSAIEHPSVLANADGADRISVTRDGVIDLADLARKIADTPVALVSVMLANNETGAIQPIAEIAKIVHAAGALLHVDAVQAFGKLPFKLRELDADLMTVSAHKIGGPTGVGALILEDRAVGLAALFRGGGQESGRRAGTENVAGIAGFGAAVDAAMVARRTDMARIAALRERLEAGLRQTAGLTVFAVNVSRLPTTTLFTVPGLRAETAVIGFDLAGIAVSSGSACSSGKVQPSHVLQAMGFSPNVARGAIRLSLGWTTTEADIDRCLEAWRSLSGALLKTDETVLERF
jgi:cysteine desulfurase